MRKRRKTKRVIFHHSLSEVGDVKTIRLWHTQPKPQGNGWSEIGYHYVITPEAETQEGRDHRLVGAHSFGRNGDSIGVCIVGDMSKKEATFEQIEAAARLYHQLCRAYSTSLKVEYHRPHAFNIFEPTTHGWFNACPGKKLDRYDFCEQLAKVDPYGQLERNGNG